MLHDALNRRFAYLRLSITDVCNFRCNYCLPDGYQHHGRSAFLSSDEITRVAAAFVAEGVSKIRLTGGEPSLRRDFLTIAQRIAALPGLQTLAVTSNGYRLAQQASAWRDAGINQLNISVDSLDPYQFHAITGENKLQQVLAGIEAAQQAGFNRIKLNAVLLRQYNANELAAFLQFIRERAIDLRFIELMQTNDNQAFFAEQHLRGEVLMQQLLDAGWLLQPKAATDGPAQVLAHQDYAGRIGFIMPYSRDFCASCNRLRVSATGDLHLCLFGDDGISLRDYLQDDEQQPQLRAFLQQALQHKAPAHRLHQANPGQRIHLASIGG